MRSIERQFRRLSFAECLGCGILVLGAITPLFFFCYGLTARGEGSVLPRYLRALSVFPTPVVFTDKTYSYRRDFSFLMESGNRIELGQAALIGQSYKAERRWMGVTVWHFLKHSPEWPEIGLLQAMEVLFCENGQEIGLWRGDALVQVDYLVRSSQMDKKVSYRCKRD